MKKLFLVMAMMVMAISANAQDGKWSIKGGIGIANIDASGCDYKLNWKVGGSYEFRVNKLIGIEPNVFINCKGYKVEGVSYYGVKTEDYTWNPIYVEVPVMCNFHLGDNWELGAGVYADFLANDDDAEGAESTDFGARIGFKYNLDNGLFLGADSEYGFTDTFKNADSKSVTVAFMIGYTF